MPLSYYLSGLSYWRPRAIIINSHYTNKLFIEGYKDISTHSLTDTP